MFKAASFIYSLCFFMIISIHANTLFGQNIDTLSSRIKTGKLDSIQSAILNQRRYIQVFLPEHYDPSQSKKYDVLYVLDGGAQNAGLVGRIENFVEKQGFMPPTIIVSVIPIDRNKELTPTHLSIVPGSGDAAEFLQFINLELLPYINKTYPSNGDNTLWGHSLSGLFVLYTLLNSPNSFTSYIAVDPSAWWDNHYILKIKNELAKASESRKTLYVGGRQGKAFNDMGTDSLREMLKSVPQNALTWNVCAYPNETHGSVALKTTYDGLKFTYEGYSKNIHFHPMHGLVKSNEPFTIWFLDDTTHVHYTLDGSVPTLSSPNTPSVLKVKGPVTVTFKSITNRSRYDTLEIGQYVDEIIPHQEVNLKRLKAGGFNYSYYEGTWDSWPDLKNKSPQRIGLTDSAFLLSKLPRKNHFALVIEGMLKISEEGFYMFSMDADSNSTFYLGNKQLIAWHGSVLNFTSSCTVYLRKGYYPYKLNYLHNDPNFTLELQYLTPGKTKPQESMPIPVDHQFTMTSN